MEFRDGGSEGEPDMPKVQPTKVRKATISDSWKLAKNSLFLKKKPNSPEEISNTKVYTAIIFGIMILFLVGFIVWFSIAPEDFGCVKLTSDQIATYKAADPLFKYSEPANNAVYFWATTTSSVGYGDITPKSTHAKYFVSVYQMFITFASLGLINYITRFGIRKYETKLHQEKMQALKSK